MKFRPDRYASALNHRATSTAAFGSAFPDVDGPFGGGDPRALPSSGDHPLVVANPPFDSAALAALPAAVERALADGRATVAVVAPEVAGRLDARSAHLRSLRSLGPLAAQSLPPDRHVFERGDWRPRAGPPNRPGLTSALLVFSRRPAATAASGEALATALATAWAAVAAKARKAHHRRRPRDRPGRST